MHAVQDSPFSAKTFFGSFYDTAYIQIVIRCLVAFALAVSRGIEDDLIISRNIVIFTNICCRFVVVIIDQFIITRHSAFQTFTLVSKCTTDNIFGIVFTTGN